MPQPINISASRGAGPRQLKQARNIICSYCGKEFISMNSVAKYCSQECSSLNQKERVRKYYHDHKEKRKLYNKNWSILNSDYIKEKRKKLRQENPDKYKLKFKDWYCLNRENQLERAAEYRKNNPEKVRESNRNSSSKRFKNDINYKILVTLRNRITNVMRRHGGKRAFSTINLIGCSIEQFKDHLKKQFKPGMTLENHGKWHIDHIIPCASFDLTDSEQQKKCFHYTNLQPLWAIDNIKKGAKTA